MSPPDHPKGAGRRVQPEGTPVSPMHGRPKSGSFPVEGPACSAKGTP
jgi:hypothetical protein